MSEKKELSQLARQILSGGGHVTMFTQSEFDEALALGKAEIMKVAIETTKQAIHIERQACAEVCKRLAEQEDEGELSQALFDASIAIMNRLR
jgi:hypothetical protein